MPRKAQRPRLWLRSEHRDCGGSLRPATWVILDRGKQFATRCSESQTAEAEKCLAAYLAAKHQPKRQRNDIEDIDIADVISIYVDDRRLLDHPSATKLFGRLERLNEFWGGKKLSEINGETCREYARHIGSEGGARRDLEDLRAAINHHAKDGYHRGIVRVVLPPKGKARDRWLTRDEVARLLYVCWTYAGARASTRLFTAVPTKAPWSRQIDGHFDIWRGSF